MDLDWVLLLVHNSDLQLVHRKHHAEVCLQVATRQEYDKVIQETDLAYSKIVESSQMLLTVLKRESMPVSWPPWSLLCLTGVCLPKDLCSSAPHSCSAVWTVSCRPWLAAYSKSSPSLLCKGRMAARSYMPAGALPAHGRIAENWSRVIGRSSQST